MVNRNPTLDNDLPNKNYFDDSVEDGTILRFNQTLENYLKITVGNDTYNLTIYNKIQFTDTTIIKMGNYGGDSLPSWRMFCNDINNNGKTTVFFGPQKTSSPTGDSWAASSPPIGSAFMYIKTSGGNHGNIIFISFEKTDLIQITNITF